MSHGRYIAFQMAEVAISRHLFADILRLIADLDVNETQVSGIKDAIASLDRGEAVSHEKVREWVLFWDISKSKQTLDH